jgi:hypothetical protein
MQLPTAVNIADNLQKDYGFVYLPEGKYRATVLTSGKMPPIKQGDKDDWFVKIIITDDRENRKFADTEFTVRLGFENHNPCNPSKPDFTWAMAAPKTVAKMADAMGLIGSVNETTQLHNKPFMLEVADKDDGKYIDKNTGETKQGHKSSKIVGYHKLPAVGGFGAPAFAAQAPVANAVAAPTVSPFTQAPAVASPPSQAPWAR